MTTIALPKPSEQTIRTLQEWAAKVGGEIRRAVDEAVKFVQMGLGNPGKLDAVRDAWNVKAVEHVATAANGVGGSAFSDLKVRWSGPAFEAFDDYQGKVKATSDKVQTALKGVGTALTSARNAVTDTYVAVVDLMTATSSAILKFTGSLAGSVQVDVANLLGQVAQAIIDLLTNFFNQYSNAVKEALKAIAKYKNAANEAAAAIATLGRGMMPELPRSARDASSYVPKKAR
ncbi:hypothetical protein [Actinophytocola sp.]|uniref:WXG100 family type VII secretion target n=1 Tax=Actinophytocola sp. TaxID=1872138 RepID=UPI002ED5D1A1